VRVTVPDARPILELRSASFGYADRAVVSAATLRVYPGDVVALLGPNGSGKSTLVKGLLGLNDHLSGEVEIFGMPRSQFRDFPRLGYVPQRHTLSGAVTATVREIVATGRLARHPWWGRLGPHDHELVDHSLELVGLADRADAEVATLSGGQQRRVLIARALSGEPDALLMDEPTAGVDAASQHVLAAVLGRLADDGSTMLIVTHELAALASIVTRVVVIDGGRIRFDGSRDDFERRAASVLHEHDSHHHDNELDLDAGPGLRRLTTGPMDHPHGSAHG
jgi:zinc transport system ATP-binding protein